MRFYGDLDTVFMPYSLNDDNIFYDQLCQPYIVVFVVFLLPIALPLLPTFACVSLCGIDFVPPDDSLCDSLN